MRLFRRRFAVVLLVWAVAVSWSGRALANPFDTYGFGGRGMAMGSALTAEARGFDAIMYNVGLLGFAENEFGFGGNFVLDDVAIRLQERPPGVDPEDYDLRFNQRSDTTDLHENQAIMFGVKHDLGLDWFAVGLSMYFPTKTQIVQKTRFNNEIAQYSTNRLHFELLGEYTQRQVLVMGAAAKPVPWLSFGLGAVMLQSSETDSYVFQPNAFDANQIFISLDNEIRENFAPHAGIAIRPRENLTIGLAYQGQIDYPIQGANFVNVTVDLGALFEFQTLSEQEINARVNWTPDRYALGVSWRPLPWWTIAADGTYFNWSSYRNNQDDPPAVDLSDRVVPRLGMEFLSGEHWAFRWGYMYAPTPFPKTTGRYNYVDNERHVLTFGAGYGFSLGDNRAELSVYGQFHHLKERTVIKDLTVENPVIDEDPEEPGLQTGNPGFPGFTSDGQLLVLGLAFTYRL